MIKKAIAALAATPMAVYAIRHLARHDANIIYYHHVGGACPHYDAFYAGCTASRFADDLHWLSRLFTFAPLDEILERSPATRASRRPRLAITFDDGFNLCRPEMIDILDRYGIKATTFVITSCLDNARLMWRHMLSVIQSLVPEEVWRARFDQLAIERNFASAAPGESVLRATRSWPPHSKDAWAEALWGRCGLRPRAEYLEANKPYFTWRGLEEWISLGHSVGFHTHTHPYCSRLRVEDLEDELMHPAIELKRRLGLPSLCLSYPFGDRLRPSMERDVYGTGVFRAMLGVRGFSAGGTPGQRLERMNAEGDPIGWTVMRGAVRAHLGHRTARITT